MVKFIQPKNNNPAKVDWKISERTRHLVKYYAEYTGFTESEVVDKFLVNLLEDKGYMEWIKNKRNNKRIVRELQLENSKGAMDLWSN